MLLGNPSTQHSGFSEYAHVEEAVENQAMKGGKHCMRKGEAFERDGIERAVKVGGQGIGKTGRGEGWRQWEGEGKERERQLKQQSPSQGDSKRAG